MRIRTIKPQFFINDDMAELSPLTRLFFIGLICCADCKGRLLASPMRLKVQILPYDEYDAQNGLETLQAAGLITLYDVDGKQYAHVCTFNQHQVLSGTEAKAQSKLPPPPNEQEQELGNDNEVPAKCQRNAEEKERAKKDLERMLRGCGMSTTKDALNEWAVAINGLPRHSVTIDRLLSIIEYYINEAVNEYEAHGGRERPKYLRHVEHLMPKIIKSIERIEKPNAEMVKMP